MVNKGLCPHCGRYLLDTDAPSGSVILLPRCQGCGKRPRVVVQRESPPLDKRQTAVLR